MRRRNLITLGMLALLLPWRGRARDRPARGEPPVAVSPVLTLTAADLEAMPEALRLRPGVQLPVVPADLPVMDPADVTPEAALLRRLTVQGRAGGLAGVIYDNRDRGHSSLPEGLFPQITRLAYGPDLRLRRRQGLDYGLAVPILLPAPAILAPVIGNSSTAVTAGPTARSLPRLAMTLPGGPMRAWTAWAGNQTWVYPEHRDHDAEDLFPANWPYMLISQGSSGSDRPLLRAAGMILAALPAATRTAAAAQGLIGPVVQMVFRRAQVRDRAAYLSGAAHPTVFEGKRLNIVAMVARAADLRPDALPPLVRLSVLDEDFTDSAGLGARSERLFDTPSAIARIWRSTAFRREMRVTAAPTGAVADQTTGQTTGQTGGAVQRYLWVLLRGDPAGVRITPEGPRDATARIGIDWQEARPVAPGQPRTSGRVDVGVFAETADGTISAPAFVSVSFPLHEARAYVPDGTGGRQLLWVDYDAVARGRAFDPMLHWSAPWRDAFIHAPDGSLTGVLRNWPDGTVTRLDAQGRRADGRAPVYEMGGTPEQPVLIQR